MNSGSLKGDRVRYIQVTAIYRAVIYRFDCTPVLITFIWTRAHFLYKKVDSDVTILMAILGDQLL